MYYVHYVYAFHEASCTKSLWRNGLAHWTSNSKVVGSSPTRDGFFFCFNLFFFIVSYLVFLFRFNHFLLTTICAKEKELLYIYFFFSLYSRLKYESDNNFVLPLKTKVWTYARMPTVNLFGPYSRLQLMWYLFVATTAPCRCVYMDIKQVHHFLMGMLSRQERREGKKMLQINRSMCV